MPSSSTQPSPKLPANSPELLQGTLDMMILRVLETGGSNHGYGIARRIRQMSDEVLIVEEGSLYPALHRLEKRGFLRSDWRPSENNRRAKYYSLTGDGHEKLRTETDLWRDLSTAIGRVMGTSRERGVLSDAC